MTCVVQGGPTDIPHANYKESLDAQLISYICQVSCKALKGAPCMWVRLAYPALHIAKPHERQDRCEASYDCCRLGLLEFAAFSHIPPQQQDWRTEQASSR